MLDDNLITLLIKLRKTWFLFSKKIMALQNNGVNTATCHFPTYSIYSINFQIVHQNTTLYRKESKESRMINLSIHNIMSSTAEYGFSVLFSTHD